MKELSSGNSAPHLAKTALLLLRWFLWAKDP